MFDVVTQNEVDEKYFERDGFIAETRRRARPYADQHG